jgi:hypothetical protein
LPLKQEKESIMSAEKMNLPGLENVNYFGGYIAKLMEVADPIPDLYRQLSKAELIKLVAVGIKYQGKLIAAEIQRLNIQAAALEEIQKTIGTFK